MPAGNETKVPSRGRGRPRGPQPDTPEVVPEKKKRGRKPGSLLKKTLAIQKRKTSRALKRASASSLPLLLAVKKEGTPTARPRQILIMLLLALPLPPDLGEVPKLEPHDDAPEARPKFSQAFVEPELAAPKPGYSGFPLEALPPQKTRKSAPGVGRGRKLKLAKSSPSPDAQTDAELAAAELQYRSKLETRQLDLLTEKSDLRTPVQPLTKKRGRPPTKNRINGVPTTPKSLKRRSDTTPGSRGTKRLKVISPRKPSGLLTPANTETQPENDDASDNDDHCTTCGGSGVFICCDSCPRSFHLLCCDPPIREIPEDNWNCNDCRAAQGMDVKRLWNELGMFGPLLNSIHGRNPLEFRLPKRLRDATFIDVSTGSDHQYTDASLKPEVLFSKSNGGQLVGYNKNEDLDIDGLYDKKGRPYLCHRCRKLGLQRRTLVSCDYCPLKWHLDCLSEPVTLAKTLGLKWRCPNHVESLLPPNWLENRNFKDTTVIDAALHRHFLKLVQSSNFLIKHSDQPYISDVRQPLLQEYILYQKEDFVSNKSAFVEQAKRNLAEESDSDNDDDVDPNFKIPDFLQNYAVDGRVVAKGSRRLARILLMTNADDPDQKPFIYRVPEQQILLDFLATRSSKDQIFSDLQNYEDRALQENEQQSDIVEGLKQLQAAPVELRKGLNLDELVAAATSAANQQVKENDEAATGAAVNANAANGTAKNAAAKRGSRARANISEDEIDELRQIKKLMEIKGRDAVLSFLQS